jgi:uncharacterized protein involved in response to NO
MSLSMHAQGFRPLFILSSLFGCCLLSAFWDLFTFLLFIIYIPDHPSWGAYEICSGFSDCIVSGTESLTARVSTAGFFPASALVEARGGMDE